MKAARKSLICLGFVLVIGSLGNAAQQTMTKWQYAFMLNKIGQNDASQNVQPTLQRLIKLLNGYQNRKDDTKHTYITWEYGVDMGNRPGSCTIHITLDKRSWVKKYWTWQDYDDANIVFGAISVAKFPDPLTGGWKIDVSGSGPIDDDGRNLGVKNERSHLDAGSVDSKTRNTDSVMLEGLDQNMADQVLQLLASANQTCYIPSN